MNIVIKSFEQLAAVEVYNIMKVRGDVFFLEQRITETDADGIDLHCSHLMCYDGDELVGYLRLIPPHIVGDEASIGRLLVVESHRRRGIGRRMMESAMAYITDEWGERNIKIAAQEYLVDFYSSMGFEAISERFFDAGIPHISMLFARR